MLENHSTTEPHPQPIVSQLKLLEEIDPSAIGLTLISPPEANPTTGRMNSQRTQCHLLTVMILLILNKQRVHGSSKKKME